MKKIFLFAVALMSFSLINAQSRGTNWLKLGAHVGVPVGDVSDVSSFMAGVDLKYQLLGIDSFGIGVATGYSNYFGKEINNRKVDDFGFVPLAGLFRFYATSSFFIGTDLGYAFSTQKNGKGGLYYRPEIGYHNEKWNIYGFYQGVSRGNSIGAVGVGISYNIVSREK